MIFRFAVLVAALCLGFAVLTLINFYQIDHVGSKSLAGRQFNSLWSYWGAYGLIAAPGVIFANIIFWAVYYYGFHFWFRKIWVVQISAFAAGLLMMGLITWLWYGEIPNKGTLLGIILCVAGTLVSIFWK